MISEKIEQAPITETKLEQEKGLKLDHENENAQEIVHNLVSSAKLKVETLVGHGEQDASMTEKEINLPASDIEFARLEVGLIDRLKAIGVDANSLFKKFKDKISGFLVDPSGYKESDYLNLRNNPNSEYSLSKENLKCEQREINGPVMLEAREKRNQILEARGLLKMPIDDFREYFDAKDFPIKTGLKQQNVGDCYAVAAIHAISQSPHFEMMCRSGMKRNPDGSWQVRLPLMSEDGQVITITPEEFGAQKNTHFLKRDDGNIMPDLRYKLRPLEGKEGLKVLEAAFMKAKFGKVDRYSAEGGQGDDVLMQLGGDNFIRSGFSTGHFNKEKKRYEELGLNSLDEKSLAGIDNFFENFDSEVQIATLSTRFAVNALSEYRVKDTLKFLVRDHAYSISKVDPENKIVTVANPWNTKKPIEFTFDQVKENFSALRAIRVNSAKLLANMNQLERRDVEQGSV